MSSPKGPTPIRRGMMADEVLKLRGRSQADAIAPAVWVKYGESVAWFYGDCTVILKRDGQDGPYRVVMVSENEEGT